MKYTIGYYDSEGYRFSTNVISSGAGTQENPYILEIDQTPRFSMENTEEFAILKRCKIGIMTLTSCSNITLIDSRIKTINLEECSNFNLKSIEVKMLFMSRCYGIEVENCRITKFTGPNCGANLIRDSKIKKISKDTDKNIIFENITGEEYGEGLKGFSQKYNVNKLVFYEVIDNAESAISREKQIKGGSREKKIELINSMNNQWLDLYYEL